MAKKPLTAAEATELRTQLMEFDRQQAEERQAKVDEEFKAGTDLVASKPFENVREQLRVVADQHGGNRRLANLCESIVRAMDQLPSSIEQAKAQAMAAAASEATESLAQPAP